MIEMRLSQAAWAMHAGLNGPDGRFSGCSTDSRTLPSGALFFALRGRHFDGHRFLDEAARRGASGAVVEQALTGAGLPLLRVSDAKQALGRLAGAWRQRFSIPFVAITGSNGKTTVKEMLAAILSPLAPTLATRGNLNNDIGVPLTLFGLADSHRYGVIELGANHPGEIAALADLVQPDVAVVTQCAPAHLEGFGSVKGVARAKAEIYAALGAGGTAIINADDAFAPYWRACCASRRQIGFGLGPEADVSAQPAPNGSTAMHFMLTALDATVPVDLPLPGKHNVMNALAAVACAVALDISLRDIVAGLESVPAVKGRLELKPGIHAARVIDDTYNANPSSLRAALEVLGSYPGRRVVVLGDMGELGASGPELHAHAGEAARLAGVERLLALGTLSRFAAQAFGAGGVHFASENELVAALRPLLAGDVTVLVKGSRAMAMERVVAAITTET